MTGSNMVPERVQKYERELREEYRRELAERMIPWLVENGVSEEELRSQFGLTVSEFEQIKNGAAAPDSD